MVSEVTHTPGPWDFKNHGADHFFATNHQYGVASLNKPTRWVAQVEGLGVEAAANARLIAAAPDLLAALKDLLWMADAEPTTEEDVEWGKKAIAAAKAAIAKANGEGE